MCLHVQRNVSRFTLALGVPETKDKSRSRFMDSQPSVPTLARSRISEKKNKTKQNKTKKTKRKPKKKKKRKEKNTSASLVNVDWPRLSNSKSFCFPWRND